MVSEGAQRDGKSVSGARKSKQSQLNATTLYLSTIRYLLLSDPNVPSTWQELYRLLPYTRQALGCCVCSKILKIPHCSSDLYCQHNVCKSCIGGKMKLKPSCSWCKDYKNFSENITLRQVVRGFKQLCCYMMKSKIYKGLQQNGSVNSVLTDIIKDGANFEDPVHKSHDSSTLVHTLSMITSLPVALKPGEAKVPSEVHGKVKKTSSEKVPERRRNRLKLKRPAASVKNNDVEPTYKVVQLSDGDKPRLMIRRKRSPEGLVRDVVGEKRKQKTRTLANKAKRNALLAHKRSGGCRCGFATASPGKLTCCGQRCPCYVGKKQCRNCYCRGCRNPFSSEGTKIFAFGEPSSSSNDLYSN